MSVPPAEPPVDDSEHQLVLAMLSLAARSDGLDVERVLATMTAGAVRLVGARYAAVALVDPASDDLGAFVHTGMPAELVARLGSPPRGRGLLGTLLRTAEPIRLHDLREHADFSGFPEHHPAMRTFLGVPVGVEGEAIGYLYLAEKLEGADFTDADEELAVALADLVAAKVRQTRRFEQSSKRTAWLDASLRISSMLVTAEAPEESLGDVCELARRVADADWAGIQVGRQGAEPERVWTAARPGYAGLTSDLDVARARRVAADVAAGGLPGRIVRGDDSEWVAVVVPLGTSTGLLGTLTLAWLAEHRRRFDTLPTELPASFAEQAALALQVAEARESGRRVAVLEDRDRIARDLHDRVVQQLFAATLGIEAAARRSTEPAVVERLREAATGLRATSREIRRTIFGLERVDEGADPIAAVERVLDRATSTLKLHPTLHLRGQLRELSREVVDDLVAVLAEGLSNVARHAEAEHVEVHVDVTADRVRLDVTDDGVGIAEAARTHGLDNLRERAVRHGGTFTVGRGPGGVGTVLTWTVPTSGCRPSAATDRPRSGPPGGEDAG